jgi:hypothetical protein
MRLRLAPAFVLRTAVLWLLLRVLLLAGARAVGAVVGEPPGNAALLALAPPAMLLTAAVVVVLVLIDVTATHEQPFQANLGFDRASILTTAFLTALGLEILTAVLVPALL